MSNKREALVNNTVRKMQEIKDMLNAMEMHIERLGEFPEEYQIELNNLRSDLMKVLTRNDIDFL